jgi:ABC-type multidrug transport system fused ATPase/permease subunit
LFFIFSVCIATVFKIIHLRLNCIVSYGVIESFGDILFKKVLTNDYKTFQEFNIKDISTTISIRSQSIGEMNYNIILIIGSLITTSLLLINIIFFISIKILIILFLVSLLYACFWLIIKKKVKYHSKIFSENFEKLNKNVYEMMQSYTDMILYKLNNYFTLDFEKNNHVLRRSQGHITFLGGYPIILIQSLVLIGLIFLVYYWNEYWNLKDQIPFFVLLVLTVQRIVPNLQTIFINYTNLSFHKENLKKTLVLLNSSSLQNKEISNQISFEKFEKIKIENLRFKYHQSEKILFENLNLEINSGDKIALMGESGSGKSTLVKIILGFLKPINGQIILNNKKLDSDIIDWWHSVVAYIPQKVFILDEDIYENISLKKNITDQNKKEIEELLKNLNLLDLISSNNNQDKKVLGGEGGKKYSGGQIQRIAIARALFQKRKFLILDETLNALDDDNIANVLDFLNKIPEVTILLIAHSNNVAKKCQKIINLENKKTNEIRIS